MKRNLSLSFCSAFVVGLITTVAGCGGEQPATPPKVVKEDHDHDHEHEGKVDHGDHAHGPNGGHLVELGNEEYHAEWEHDDATGLITIYLLDKDAKNLPETDATEIVIETKVGEKSSTYSLPRVPSESETKKVSKFELVDKTLLNSLMATEGVSNTLKIKIGDKEFSAAVKHDPSHDH